MGLNFIGFVLCFVGRWSVKRCLWLFVLWFTLRFFRFRWSQKCWFVRWNALKPYSRSFEWTIWRLIQNLSFGILIFWLNHFVRLILRLIWTYAHEGNRRSQYSFLWLNKVYSDLFKSGIWKRWLWSHFILFLEILLIVCFHNFWGIMPLLIPIRRSLLALVKVGKLLELSIVRCLKISFDGFLGTVMFSCIRKQLTTSTKLTNTFKFFIMLDKIMLIPRMIVHILRLISLHLQIQPEISLQ